MQLHCVGVRVPIHVALSIGEQKRARPQHGTRYCCWPRSKPSAVMGRDKMVQRSQAGMSEETVIDVPRKKDRTAARERHPNCQPRVIEACPRSAGVSDFSIRKSRQSPGWMDHQPAFCCQNAREPRSAWAKFLIWYNPNTVHQVRAEECCMKVVPVPMRQNYGRFLCFIEAEIVRRGMSVDEIGKPTS